MKITQAAKPVAGHLTTRPDLPETWSGPALLHHAEGHDRREGLRGRKSGHSWQDRQFGHLRHLELSQPPPLRLRTEGTVYGVEVLKAAGYLISCSNRLFFEKGVKPLLRRHEVGDNENSAVGTQYFWARLLRKLGIPSGFAG